VLTVEGIKLEVLAAKAAGQQLKMTAGTSFMCPVTSPLRRLMRAVQALGGGGLLVRDCSRHARPWQKPLKYDTWSRSIAHGGGPPC
jgi:hypothetical protein